MPDHKPKPAPKSPTKPRPAGTERTSFNLPSRTMDAIRREAVAEGCTLNYIAGQVLNAYARGEIRRDFTQPGEAARKP